MRVGERLRSLRESKHLTQQDIQDRSGLLRPYISLSENGVHVPSVENLERLARALDVPMYQLFINVTERPKVPKKLKDGLWGSSKKDARMLSKFLECFKSMTDEQLEFLLATARQMQTR